MIRKHHYNSQSFENQKGRIDEMKKVVQHDSTNLVVAQNAPPYKPPIPSSIGQKHYRQWQIGETLISLYASRTKLKVLKSCRGQNVIFLKYKNQIAIFQKFKGLIVILKSSNAKLQILKKKIMGPNCNYKNF